jgi:hypothetical protein
MKTVLISVALAVPGSIGAVLLARAGGPEAPWQRHVILAGLAGADGARLADADGDGDLDLVTGWEQSGVVTICLNPGRTTVKRPWPAIRFPAVTPGVEDAVLVDLDGDGATDVVTCCEGKGRAVFVHWAPQDAAEYSEPAKWTVAPIPATAGRLWMFAIALQVDGRHGTDLVVGAKGTGAVVGWLEAPADPRDLTGWRLHPIAEAGWVMSLVSRDMDGDGDPDVLLSDRKGPRRGVRWLENPGPGGAQTKPWADHVIGAAGREVMFLANGDLDGDGREDVVVNTTDGGLVYLRRLDRTGRRWAVHAIPHPDTIGTGKAVSVGDVDGDGRPDLVLSCEHAKGKSGIVWLSSRGDPAAGGWRRHEVSGPEGVKFDLVPLADLDGDGDPDVITTEETAGLGIVWYENPRR